MGGPCRRQGMGMTNVYIFFNTIIRV